MREKRRTTLIVILSVIIYMYIRQLPVPTVDNQAVSLYFIRTFSFLISLMSVSYLLYLNFIEWLTRGNK